MRKILKYVAVVLASLFLLNTTVFAHEGIMPLASDYISGTYSNITPGSNGNLTIAFRVSSPAPMTVLGASSIEVYEDNGQTTELVKTVLATDDGYSHLLGSGLSHSGNIKYAGTVGYKYYVKVYFTASNSTGGDAITSTSPTVTAKR